MKRISIAILLLIAGISIALVGCKKEQVETNSNNTSLIRKTQETSINRKKQETPIEEMKCDELVSCAKSNPKCETEFKERLKSAASYVDSIYAEGDVCHEDSLLFPYIEKFKCGDSRSALLKKSKDVMEGWNENTRLSDVVDKRIRKLLPEKGCVEDSLQYIRLVSTIKRLEYLLKKEKKLSPDQERFLNYLNRNCSYNYNDERILSEEERIIKTALEYNIITKSKGEKLYNDKFNQIERNNDLGIDILETVYTGTLINGVGKVKKKKNRTLSYIEYTSAYELDAETALSNAIVSLFKSPVYTVFLLHPSVENIEIGFAVFELEYNLYMGYYHGIYAVTIKSNRLNLEKYFSNKNNKLVPNFADSLTRFVPFINVDDAVFLAKKTSFSVMKKWCKINGFTCSKYLLERVR